MEELKKQVRRAGWLLGLQRFVGALGWSCGIALSAALVPIVLRRIVVFGVEDWVWLVGALGVGVLAAIAWAVIRSPGRLGAAMEIDRRFGLKERVSTALSLDPPERESEAGCTVVQDALRRIARIDVPDRFRVEPGRQLLLPLAPAVVALLVGLLIDPAEAKPVAEDDQPEPAATASASELKNVKKSSELLRQEWAQRLRDAEEKDLDEAKRLFEKLERGTERLIKEEPDRKQALVELNKLAREIQKRREQLGEVDKIRKHMNQLKRFKQGPAKDLADALRRGDFNSAAKAIDKLKQQIADSKLSSEDKQKLIDQLSELQNQLKDKADKVADAHNAAKNDLQNRLKQAKASGNSDEAAKIQKQLDQLMRQLPQIDQLQDLASKLGQCTECLKDGSGEQAAKALGQLKDSLDALQKELDEMAMLDDAMNQLGQCRSRMCGGQGNQVGQRPFGDGMGKGPGVGFRPEEENDTSLRNSRVRPRVGEGSPIVVGSAPGPNTKGEAREKIRQQFEEIARGKTDPLTGQRIPRQQREHAREYFDSYREGE